MWMISLPALSIRASQVQSMVPPDWSLEVMVSKVFWKFSRFFFWNSRVPTANTPRITAVRIRPVVTV